MVQHKSIGHILYALGCLLILVMVTMLSPANLAVTKALSANTIIELTNQNRQRLNKPAFNVNASLMSAAQAKAEDMVAKKYFDHYGPNGETPWQFFKNAQYDYEYAGENLAITNEDDTQVVEGWMNSPSHRENLLSEKYVEFGIGIAAFGDYEGHKNTTVVVAMYGKQKTAQNAIASNNEPTAPAGAMTILKPNIFNTTGVIIISSFAVALITAGIMLELRHIKRHNHPNFS